MTTPASFKNPCTTRRRRTGEPGPGQIDGEEDLPDHAVRLVHDHDGDVVEVEAHGAEELADAQGRPHDDLRLHQVPRRRIPRIAVHAQAAPAPAPLRSASSNGNREETGDSNLRMPL